MPASCMEKFDQVATELRRKRLATKRFDLVRAHTEGIDLDRCVSMIVNVKELIGVPISKSARYMVDFCLFT